MLPFQESMQLQSLFPGTLVSHTLVLFRAQLGESFLEMSSFFLRFFHLFVFSGKTGT